MRYRINDQIVFQKPPGGPLVPWLTGLAESLKTQRFPHQTIHVELRRIVQFSEWLEHQQVELSSLSPADVVQYLQTRPLRSQQQGSRAPLRRLLEYLRSEDVIDPEEPAPPPTPAECCVQDYVEHLRKQRGLAEDTIVNYARQARNFLQHRFASGKVVLSHLNADDVIAFVRDETARLPSPKSKAKVSGSLRAFLRYVHVHADGMPDLASYVPRVASWPMSSLPRAIAADQTQKLLKSVDRTTPVGRRDYAILLLLARLGLRAGAIVFLTLEDIDWTAGTLTVTQKGARHSVYPLTEEIGEAIADYLQNGRPKSSERLVFLHARAPFRPFRRGSDLSDMIRYRIDHAGVEAPTRGSHQFRHALATEMQRRGASLSEIGDVLGHRSANATRIYAKVDVVALRSLALPWPGGVQ
ncbi:MAG: tyrosine-type recombinase/integrase [Acidobacteria bacterium]|nr:tyrosine-type recombinase/integrase [Acidobacteriota bacterium]